MTTDDRQRKSDAFTHWYDPGGTDDETGSGLPVRCRIIGTGTGAGGVPVEHLIVTENLEQRYVPVAAVTPIAPGPDPDTAPIFLHGHPIDSYPAHIRTAARDGLRRGIPWAELPPELRAEALQIATILTPETEAAPVADVHFVLCEDGAVREGHVGGENRAGYALVGSVRRGILDEAANLIDGERNAQYGDPTADFDCTARLWQTYLERTVAARGTLDVQPHDVAVLQVLLKISRISWSPGKRDHWVDIAGYGGCGGECAALDPTPAP